jgi:SAM-dependent methyltransferase
LAFVVQEWDSLKNTQILDYGCGVMPYREAFEMACAEVVGADIQNNPKAQICIPENGKLPLADESFDYVTSFQVLEHVPTPREYLTEAYRLLKRGGKLFLTTNGSWPYHPTPEDYHRWTRQGLIHEIKSAGFDIESTGHVLNDYSSALQSFVMTGSYHNAWKRFSLLVHLWANIHIWILEHWNLSLSEIPAVLSITGVKR